MKKASFFFIALTFLIAAALPAIENIQINNVNIPKDFIHDGKDFVKGIYHMSLTEKDGVAVFLVHNKENELLFEEIAVIKPYLGKGKEFKPRINKTALKDYEYYRVKVTTPESLYMAFFLLKN